MSKKLYSYNPTQVVITYNGVRIQGYGEGDFLTISKQEDDYSEVKGADGDVTVSFNPDDTYDVTLTLNHGSSSNDFMSTQRIAGRASGGVLSTGPLFIKDTQGRDVFISEAAWIVKPADTVKGKEAGDREWTLRAFNGQDFVGGL